jgi:hypothetical protein
MNYPQKDVSIVATGDTKEVWFIKCQDPNKWEISECLCEFKTQEDAKKAETFLNELSNKLKIAIDALENISTHKVGWVKTAQQALKEIGK